MRDYPDIYGPAVYWLNGFILWLSHGRILPVRQAIAVFKATAVALTYLLTRNVASRPFALMAAALATAYWGRHSWNLNTPYGALYSACVSLLSVLLLVRALVGGSRATAFVTAGLSAGTTVLFKQSIGLVQVYGFVLALWAVGMLENRSRTLGRLEVSVSTLLWVVAGLLGMIPIASLMTARDYALHFLPLHLLMALLGGVAFLRGPGVSIRPLLASRVLSFAAGCTIAPGMTFLAYAGVGGADELFHNMFILSRKLQNYYKPVGVPSLWLVVLSLGAIGSLSGLMLLARGGARRQGAWIASSGVALFAAARWLAPAPQLGESTAAVFAWSADAFLGIQSTVISLGAIVILARRVMLPPTACNERLVRVLVPLLFFQTMALYEIFPRAGFNVLTHAGSTVPLLAFLLYRWHRLCCLRGAPLVRRLAASIIVLAVPVWMSAQAVTGVWQAASTHTEAALRWPPADGIRLSPDEAEGRHIPDLELLVAYLERSEPKDAPVFLLAHEPMILLLSGRKPLFRREAHFLHLLAFDMLPEPERQALLDEREMVARLESRPDTLVIRTTGPPEDALTRRLPKVGSHIERNYRVEAELGRYQVLRDRRFVASSRQFPLRASGRLLGSREDRSATLSHDCSSSTIV